jgi:hypothetical protein
VSIIARLRAAWRNRQAPPPPQRALPYRASPDSGEALVRDIETRLAGLALRVRALEHQLEVRGEEPTPSPTGRQLVVVAEILDALSRSGDLITRWTTRDFRDLAVLVRGLARYHR